MKRTFIALAAMAMSLMACNKIEGPVQETLPLDKYVINANIPGFNQETKAMKSDWADGDKINIWFDSIKGYAETPDLIPTYDETSQTWTGTPTTAPANNQGPVYALFEGYNDISSAYSHTSLNLPPKRKVSISGSGNIYASPMTYVVNGSSRSSKGITADYTKDGVNININITKWECLEKIRVFIEGLPEQTEGYALKCDDFYNSYLYITSTGDFSLILEKGQYTYEVTEGSDKVFYFASNSNRASAATRIFTLYDSKTKTTKTYTISNKTFNSTADMSICSGIKLTYSDFE